MILHLDRPPSISIKDAFKHLFNKIVCERTDRTIEQNQNGILVNLFYGHDSEKEEAEKLLAVKPFTLNIKCENRKNKR